MASDFPPKLSGPLWSDPPAKLMLARNEVHIWRVTLELPTVNPNLLRDLLSSNERARAERFVFSQHRDRFIVAHGFLRVILSSYLNCSPAEIAFTYDEHGKPWLLSPDHHGGKLNFNLAHSAMLAIYGVTLGRAIGVDIEHIRTDFAVDEIARSAFSANDAHCLFSLPPHERQKAFFDGWTRKEAFIKAKGTGLSLPLDQFDVTLAPGEPAALLETRWDKSEVQLWSLRAMDVAPDYAASIAVQGHDWSLKCWQANQEMLHQRLQ
jgi:4'-phosphopantetheinyl transferase